MNTAKEIKLFFLNGCPYCRNARTAVEELCKENPAYAAIPIRWIEEREESEVADAYDYFRVPTLFYRDEKLYEASPGQDYNAIRENIRAAFDRVLAEG